MPPKSGSCYFGFPYCRFPLVDGPGNDRKRLQLAITTVANLLEKKVPTLVVCGAGQPVDPIRAAKVPVVLRVKGADAVKARAVVFYQAEVVAVLKNTSGQVLGKTIDFSGSVRADAGVPKDECTIYLENYDPAQKSWAVLGLNVDQQGVSHVGPQKKAAK
jgi:hypothetical protein